MAGVASYNIFRYISNGNVFKMESFDIKSDGRNLPTLYLEDIFEYAISNADILKTEFSHWKIARLLYIEIK